MPVRAIYICKLKQILEAEGSPKRVIEKARRAHIGQLWVKLAEGRSPYANVLGSTGRRFQELIHRATEANIEVWGWHVPHCATAADTKAEVGNLRTIAQSFGLGGLIMDAEGGPEFFQGDLASAALYGKEMRTLANDLAIKLAISSNDIPSNIANWRPRFDAIAVHADYNFPQTYYGSSPSVANRVDRAERGNAHLVVPFCPVGAAWIGDGGGCASASACAERAAQFIALAKDREYEIYSFWHWAGAPLAFWEVLNRTAP